MSNKIFNTNLAASEKPMVSVIHSCKESKISLIVFKKDSLLSKHKTLVPALLWVIKGCVRYVEDNSEIFLNELSQKEIPVNVFHEVVAVEDSHCILIQNTILST